VAGSCECGNEPAFSGATELGSQDERICWLIWVCLIGNNVVGNHVLFCCSQVNSTVTSDAE
jgi:hypothetical protein